MSVDQPRTLVLDGRPLPVVGTARVYVCGITPYDVTHLGHAATFVWSDVAARVLRTTGVNVEVARNITDVDEVLLAEARRQNRHYEDIAAVQRHAFDQSMRALRVRAPDHEPTARGAVPAVVQLAAALLASGDAYEAGGNVWLNGAEVPTRAGLTPEQAEALLAEFGERPAPSGGRSPFDTLLWRGVPAEEPLESRWPSPWGPGRPGWHAECAAMALTTLGSGLDLHTGGQELRFPHHAYETAIAEAASGVRPFARAWLHPGTVLIDGAKMAKSTGNLVLVGDLLADVPAAVLRVLLLDRPWGQSWEYRRADVDAAVERLDALRAAAMRSGSRQAPDVVPLLLDDLDVPAALDLAIEAGGSTAIDLVDLLRLE